MAQAAVTCSGDDVSTKLQAVVTRLGGLLTVSHEHTVPWYTEVY